MTAIVDLRALRLILWAVCALLASAHSGFAAREVRVGAYDYSPLISLNAHEDAIGIFPEILADIAQREGLRITYVYGTWEDVLRWGKNGEIDLIPGIAQVRGQSPDYSVNKEPVLFSWSQLYTAKGTKAISLMDLDGKKVVGLRGDMNLQVFKELAAPFGIKIHYVEVDDINQAFQMVVRGEAIAAVSERITSQIFEKKYPVERNPIMFSPQSLAFGTAKGKNQDLLDAIDRYLVAAKTDPDSSYYQILQKWKETEPFEIPPYVIWGFAGALGLLVLSAGGNMLLKHQVERKTLELSDQNFALQEEIAERKRTQDDLKRAKEAAERANNAKDQFIAVLSHELRTPLTPVLAAITAGEKTETLDASDIHLIRRNVEMEAKLIDDLLDAIGIEPEFMPRIYRAFEQGEKTKIRRFGGLGLGLHIAKALVEMHEGTLTSFSEGKDKGTTFTVELAAVSPEPQPPTPSAALEQSEDQMQRILLVDDHADTLQTMSKLLQRWGYFVTTADSVQSALDVASTEPFDLLISDIGLPDGSGWDIMRQVKKLYGMSGIAFSGFGTDADLGKSRESGFEEHLVKPISFQTLRMAMLKSAPKAKKKR